MFATGPSNRGSKISGPNTPLLDVPAMIEPILENYDAHVNNFIRFLRDRLGIRLVYEGPDDVRQNILQKSVYACSVYCKPKKILKDVFPVMIGSRLDIAIRHLELRSFPEPFDLSEPRFRFPFQELDVGTGFFIIGGFLRHLPYFYTNDPTNTHVIQRKIVRVYSYNERDRGKELNFFVADLNRRRCGDVVIVHNDGTETEDDPDFFHHCPYPVHLTAYMSQLHRDEGFDIDHLGNKMVISPGHMFTRLFVKYLYGPLRDQDWKLVKMRVALVCSSIENGYLLHVLSRKTVYFKEAKSVGKMTKEPRETHREIGANGEVFMEKNIGCYREVLTQTYPLNPYLLYVIIRQVSKKVNSTSIDSWHGSYLYFLCNVGNFETKNVGRTTMMVRDSIVTTCNDLDPVYHDAPNASFWEALNLEPQKDSRYHVVVNEACIPVTKVSFERVNLRDLKFRFEKIECYPRGSFFKIVRYKMGLIMKKLPDLPIYVTPYDASIWIREFYGERGRSLHATSHIVDLNRFFNHTAFPKVILAINSLKNAVLATTPKYALYFMDTVSTYYREPTPHHEVLIQPRDDGISKHFVLTMPRPVVAYMSFEGCTQEDCIVKRKDYRAFDCVRFYTLRLKIVDSDPATWVKFYPVGGHEDPESDLVGTVISGRPLEVDPYSMHVRLDKVNSNEYRVHFAKKPFRVVQHFLAGDKLTISLEQDHEVDTGDKLCSLHGQKGVIRVMDKLPLLDGRIEPDLIVNVYCMFRMTPGQIIEARVLGGGKDSEFVVTQSCGTKIPAKVYYGKTFYYGIVYWSGEHLYVAANCKIDIVNGAPVKGRSRLGGMKLGNMEVNALRANGIAAAFEEKFFQHSDRMQYELTVPLPKSIIVVLEDLKCYKFLVEFESFPSIIIK